MQKKYGVWFNKQEQKWIADITYKRKKTYLGRFETKDDAHAAYFNAYVETHGVTPW